MQTRALRRIAGLTLALAAAFAACDQRPPPPDRARADRQSLVADEDSGAAEFEGEVASVDVEASSLTLDDGTVIRVDSTTEWDSEGDYGSLEEIAAALGDDSTGEDTASSDTTSSDSTSSAAFFASDTASGDSTATDSTSGGSTTVVVEGEGAEKADGSIVASRMKAEAEDGDEGTEFGGEVSSVDVEGSSLTLGDSTVIRVDSATEWDDEGDYGSLEEIAAALEDDSTSDTTASTEDTAQTNGATWTLAEESSGDSTASEDSTSDGSTTVVVEGEGETQADGSVLASRIRAEADDGDDGDGEKPTAGEEVEFEGGVLAVHGKSEHHQLNLEGGRRIAVDSTTEWTGAYGSLDAVAAAVDSGRSVHAAGAGVEQHDGSVVADEIEAGPKTAEFEDEVASVNPENGNHQVRLDGGTRLEVPDDASWSGDASSLAELDAAADTASSVTVEGEGTQGRNGVIAVAEIEVEVADDAEGQGQDGKGERGGKGNSGNDNDGNSGNGQGNAGGQGGSGNSGNGNGQGQGNGGGDNGNGQGNSGNGNNGKGKGGGGGNGGG